MADSSASPASRLRLVEALVVLPSLALIALFIWRDADQFRWAALSWAVLIGAIELLHAPTWRGLTISVGLPLMMLVAFLYPPGVAGVITWLGASDPREFKGQVSIGVSLYNRSQVALSVVAASFTFHSLADFSRSPLWILFVAAAAASIADYLVNASLVTLFMSTKLRASVATVVRQLTIGSVRDFFISYLGLGVLGLTLAKFYVHAGLWSVPAYLAPVIFARQAFFRARALEEAHEELQQREEILRELSNTMAEERADERLQIAGYLHDDLAQVLFRLSLQVDVARKLLERDDLDELSRQLDKIRNSKQETSDRVRALIRDLHRSPLGAKGLSEAIESFTDEVGRDGSTRFHRDIADIALPAPIALLVYHVAREGVMNALKHAHATDMWIGVREDDDDIVLELRDNGVGFDTSAPGPEGHFGMAMMRERAKVGGGSIDAQSAPGEGTTITVRFPIALLQRDQPPAGVSDAPPANRAIPPTGGAGPTQRPDSGSRDSVSA
jgi:Signal transduction histidine kinase